jgi:hypothetical protein
MSYGDRSCCVARFRLALGLRAADTVQYIYPIFLGDNGKAFSAFGKGSEEVVEAVEQRVQGLLSQADERRISPKAALDQIFLSQGTREL